MLSSVFLFLNIGTPELMLIMFVALLLFGGDKLPGIAKGLGKGIRDFKDASEGVKREIHNQINNYEEKKPEQIAEAPAVSEDKPTSTLPEITPADLAKPMYGGYYPDTDDHYPSTDAPQHDEHTAPTENQHEVKNVTPGIDLTKKTQE